jgi:DNA-binding CsgD family transcriptional regulator
MKTSPKNHEERQAKIAKLWTLGLSRDEIAERTGFGKKMIGTHLTKLGLAKAESPRRTS